VVIDEARALIDRLPELREKAVTFLNKRGAEDLARQVQEYDPSRAFGPGVLASTGRQVLGVVTGTVSIFVLTAYILFDARRIEQFLYFSTPARYHPHIRNLLTALQRVVGGYIRGQLVTSGFIAVFTFLTLTVLQVPNALALAVLAGVADMIPMVGVFLAVIPATLAALSLSLPKAIIVAALLVFYQEFENRVLVQRVYGATLRLPAVAVLLSLLIGAELLGVAGALLSLPAAAAVRVFIEYGYDVRRGRVPDVAPPEEPFAPDVDERPRAPLRRAP
jgi:predicted PurR-regulated permease PerM